MIEIFINSKFEAEKKYILNCFFNEFLGLSCIVTIRNNVLGYKIVLSNKNCVVVSDSFFEKVDEKYFESCHKIPEAVSYLKSPFREDEEIPVLYGDSNFEISINKISIGADIFSSAFFMLTRWEENSQIEKDKHNRFPFYASVASKFGFLDRPIVNEYVELLWSSLLHLGISQKRIARNFEIIPTHDVDLPRMWWNLKDFVKSLSGDLFKRRSVRNVIWSIKQYYNKIITGKDPFDTFDYLMTISENNNLKSHFFFMSGGTSKKDNYYRIDHPVINQLMDDINKRGHCIGFHPSYNAYNDASQFANELKLLQSISPQPIKLIERPLIVMDGSLFSYQDLSPEEGYNKINYLVQKVKEYNGEFVILWHNSAFNTPTWKNYQLIYERILNENSNNSRGKTSIYKSCYDKQKNRAS